MIACVRLPNGARSVEDRRWIKRTGANPPWVHLRHLVLIVIASHHHRCFRSGHPVRGGSVAQGSSAYACLSACSRQAVRGLAHTRSLSDVSGAAGDPHRSGRLRDRLCHHGFAPAWRGCCSRDHLGDDAGAFATCNAYIADVTPPKESRGYGLVGAPLVLVLCWVRDRRRSGAYEHPSSLLRGGGLRRCELLYGALVLPSRCRRSTAGRSRGALQPRGSLLALRRSAGGGPAWMYFIFMLGNTMLQSIWSLHGYRYHWTTLTWAFAYVYRVVAVLVQGGLVRRIIARTGERKGLVIGLVISAVIMRATVWRRRVG